MTTHELKCWPEPFEAIQRGDKTFELRRDDRGFALGDTLVLREYKPEGGYPGTYTGRQTTRSTVTYILHGGRFGLPPDLCVMAIRPDVMDGSRLDNERTQNIHR